MLDLILWQSLDLFEPKLYFPGNSVFVMFALLWRICYGLVKDIKYLFPINLIFMFVRHKDNPTKCKVMHILFFHKKTGKSQSNNIFFI